MTRNRCNERLRVFFIYGVSMKELKPLMVKTKYYEGVEKKNMQFFEDILFKPVMDIIKKYVGKNFNSVGAVVDALNSGRIQFSNGQFSGNFNSKISAELSKIGAKFSASSKTWNISIRELPFEIQSAVAVATSRFKKLHDEVMDYLDSIDVESITRNIGVEHSFEGTISDIDKDIKTGLPKTIGVSPELSEETIKNISKKYAANMELSIKNFTKSNVSNLRAQVIDNTFEGMRAENLVELLKKNYSVTHNKARFLARQETSLLMSEFRESRYKDLGVTKYRWSTSNDARVRDEHKAVNGKIFTWDNPPAVGVNGERVNPGQDFGCRCVAVPIVEV